MRIEALPDRAPTPFRAASVGRGAHLRRRPARGRGRLNGFILEYSLGANPMLHELALEDFPVVDGMIEIPVDRGSASPSTRRLSTLPRPLITPRPGFAGSVACRDANLRARSSGVDREQPTWRQPPRRGHRWTIEDLMVQLDGADEATVKRIAWEVDRCRCAWRCSASRRSARDTVHCGTAIRPACSSPTNGRRAHEEARVSRSPGTCGVSGTERSWTWEISTRGADAYFQIPQFITSLQDCTYYPAADRTLRGSHDCPEGQTTWIHDEYQHAVRLVNQGRLVLIPVLLEPGGTTEFLQPGQRRRPDCRSTGLPQDRNPSCRQPRSRCPSARSRSCRSGRGVRSGLPPE